MSLKLETHSGPVHAWVVGSGARSEDGSGSGRLMLHTAARGREEVARCFARRGVVDAWVWKGGLVSMQLLVALA